MIAIVAIVAIVATIAIVAIVAVVAIRATAAMIRAGSGAGAAVVLPRGPRANR